MICTCDTCGREYVYRRQAGHSRSRCNSCYAKKSFVGAKARWIEYKGGACQICGYNKCEGSLGFHHLDPTQKKFAIAGSHTRSWESIKRELDKCVLVCQNCHGEIHAGLIELPSVAQR